MSLVDSGHAAVRTCVGCRASAPKPDLWRIVRGPDGLLVDAAGSGRGAYVHPSRDCVSASASARLLARALRTGVSSDEVGRLEHVLVSALGVR